MIMPGAPQYLEWVQASTEQKKEMVKSLEVESLAPNPDLVYETVTGGWPCCH